MSGLVVGPDLVKQLLYLLLLGIELLHLLCVLGLEVGDFEKQLLMVMLLLRYLSLGFSEPLFQVSEFVLLFLLS